MTQTIEPVDAKVMNTGALGATAALAVVTVAANQYWKPSRLYVQWATSATAGNRIPKFTIADASANVVCEVITTLNLAAQLTATYNVLAGAPTTGTFLTPVIGLRYTVYGLPALTMGPGWTITSNDTAAVDAAGDTVTLYLSYALTSPTLI